jgi:glycosyltransferase involved in cell wall biosynthesis
MQKAQWSEASKYQEDKGRRADAHTPYASVLIDTFNHERFIQRVVVDDGSSDKTSLLLEKYGKQIQVHRKPNHGQASAFNDGVRLCEGDIIAFLDGDDWWHEHKLSRVIATFESYPEICAVGHGIIIVDEVANVERSLSPRIPVRLNHHDKHALAPFRECMCYLGTSRLAARRDALLALLDIPTDLVFEADEYLFTLLPAYGPVLVLPEMLTYYRIHGANFYQDSDSSAASRISDWSTPRFQAKARIYECLSETLPQALRRLGCSEDVVEQLLEPVRLEARRLRFMVSGGARWNNFLSEWKAIKQKTLDWHISKLAFAGCTLFLAMVLPPRSFFRLRQAYSSSWLRHVRGG